ncbi:MAG TPA: hypothetical protein PLY93_10390 [Turneriella sp.]|nr:hypothetical protein [Turneriella sp.]
MSKLGRHYAENEMRHYLDEKLDAKAAEGLKQHLETCRECFTLYMEIREIEYLQHIGQGASAALRERVKTFARQASGKLIRVRFKVLRDKFILMSGDSENLEFQGVRANFAYRGKTERGPVSFSHKIDNQLVTLTLIPVEGKKNYKVAVDFSGKKEKICAHLNLHGKTVETIADLRKQAQFLSIVERGQEIDLRFEKSGKELFTINFGID